MMERVSVVVLTRGPRTVLAQTLAALDGQRHRSFEVIVVRDPSCEGEDGEFGHCRARLREVESRRAGRAAARNAGLRVAAGEMVAFLDAGVLPEPTWLSRGVAGFDDPEVAAVGGPVLSATGVRRLSGISVTRLGEQESVPDATHLPCVPGAIVVRSLPQTNALFRADALRASGSFDEFFADWLDVADCCRRLADAGFVVALADGAVYSKTESHLTPAVADDLKRWESVAREMGYFAARHGDPSDIGVDLSSAVAMSLRRRLNARAVSRRRSVLDDPRWWMRLERAAAAGVQLAQQGFAPTASNDKVEVDEFVDFEGAAPPPLTLRIGVVAPMTTPGSPLTDGLQEASRQLGERGCEVRLMTSTAGELGVSLEGPLWVHRLAAPESAEEWGEVVANEFARLAPWWAADVVFVPPAMSAKSHFLGGDETTVVAFSENL